MTQPAPDWQLAAAADLKAPSVGGVIRWAHHAAAAKGKLAAAERKLKQLEQVDLQNSYRADSMPSQTAVDMVRANAPGEIVLARALVDFAAATEAHDFADRMAALVQLKLRQPAEPIATKPKEAVR